MRLRKEPVHRQTVMMIVKGTPASAPARHQCVTSALRIHFPVPGEVRCIGESLTIEEGTPEPPLPSFAPRSEGPPPSGKCCPGRLTSSPPGTDGQAASSLTGPRRDLRKRRRRPSQEDAGPVPGGVCRWALDSTGQNSGTPSPCATPCARRERGKGVRVPNGQRINGIHPDERMNQVQTKNEWE